MIKRNKYREKVIKREGLNKGGERKLGKDRERGE